MGTTGTLSLSVEDVSMEEGDSGTTDFVFTVTAQPIVQIPTTVNIQTTTGTATEGVDFVALIDTLTFNPTDTFKTFTVQVNDDTAFEPDETFTVIISSTTEVRIADAEGTGTIVNDNDDDDSPPSAWMAGTPPSIYRSAPARWRRTPATRPSPPAWWAGRLPETRSRATRKEGKRDGSNPEDAA